MIFLGIERLLITFHHLAELQISLYLLKKDKKEKSIEGLWSKFRYVDFLDQRASNYLK